MSNSRPSQMATPPTFTSNRLISIIWHSICVMILTYALKRLPIHANMSGFNVEEQFGSHYQFLTVLGLWFSRMTSLFALSSDLAPQSSFMRWQKTMLTAITMPSEVLISLLYWPILFTNPDLLIPPRAIKDPKNPGQFVFETVRLPLLDDLSFHAAPALILLIDYLFFQPKFPKNTKPIFMAVFSTAAYGIWVEICARKNKTYPYPLLTFLTNTQRVTLYSVCAIIFVVITISVTFIHNLLDRVLQRQWDQVGGMEGKGVVGSIDSKEESQSSSRKK